jgi:spore germination protein GerM
MAPDALRLQEADREVEFGEGTLEQARHLIEALLEPAPEPLVSPLPAGTQLRGLYATENGTVFVDLSQEAASGQPGGILEEELTVYSVVNTLADNLPAVTAVQVLVNGQEVDTLAGHVDLRRPLVKNAALTEAPQPAP